ncbi:hypothetical protein [Streptomyces sp. NRRL F-5123]|uniref:hypothetical protein n=1 Tax=Streptomyces sp. NRRL F-5123 TaxID=1463856 RepID=UPI0006937233|nr:hypothetical protein [Streptomyces sp. NRRL F-5123]
MACTNRDHRPAWRVEVRKANYSAFNGGRRTPSDYSQVRCGECGARWRTKAAYVAKTPDAEACAGRCGYLAETACRICRRPYCRECLTDHHHEGYGTPAADTR